MMEKIYKKSIFIFRRDFRLEDNTSLLKALSQSEEVLPIFILNPNQVESSNEYRSLNSLQFLFNSLKELDLDLKKLNSKLYLFYGNQIEILEELISNLNIDSIFENFDYTPFAKKRSSKIKDLCENKKIEYHTFEDYVLVSPLTFKKADGTPYGVFTPFYKKASLNDVSIPLENNFNNYFKNDIKSSLDISYLDSLLDKKNENIFVKGGRREALEILNNLNQYENYSTIRDFPAIRGTTGLSAHLKFGTVSCREVYLAVQEKLGIEHPLIRQLYWKDFWVQIAFNFPRVFGKNYLEKFENVKWDFEKDLFKAWCEGKTGYPIVDAGMRELVSTGYMHNRVRMIVASFLTKDLHIHWKYGEKFFAQHLVDYDPCLNNGNWQWGASTGCDGQPYFRVFNPWRQQERFDKDCEYVKKWVSELERFSAEEIRGLEKDFSLKFKDIYYPQIVDHSVESKEAIRRFKEC